MTLTLNHSRKNMDMDGFGKTRVERTHQVTADCGIGSLGPADPMVLAVQTRNNNLDAATSKRNGRKSVTK